MSNTILSNVLLFVPATPLLRQPCNISSKTKQHIFKCSSAKRGTVVNIPEPTRKSIQQSKKHENLPSPSPSSCDRMFSNIAPDRDGQLRRVKASEMGCIALVAGTMIGAGVLALPSVAQPVGFGPSSTALLGIWAYMAATGLLISEVSVNTACTLGRPNGISILSLGELTLGRVGSILTAFSYMLLHYAILTAYTSQGGVMLSTLFTDLLNTLHLPPLPTLPSALSGVVFASVLGGGMYTLSASKVEKINNLLVAGVVASFAAVLSGTVSMFNISRLVPSHWTEIPHGPLIPVLFVSCVYHNVVSTISMRLEGDRVKIRRTILLGSLLPVLMFLAYDAAILGADMSSIQTNDVAVAMFSVLAVATSFVGFVEGLTEVWRDARRAVEGVVKEDGRWKDFAATIVPPVVFAGMSPDVFLKALDAAGTYGIAVLFGGLPAAMAWRNRRKEVTKEFSRSVGGGDWVLGAVAVAPVMLIGSRIWQTLNGG